MRRGSLRACKSTPRDIQTAADIPPTTEDNCLAPRGSIVQTPYNRAVFARRREHRSAARLASTSGSVRALDRVERELDDLICLDELAAPLGVPLGRGLLLLD